MTTKQQLRWTPAIQEHIIRLKPYSPGKPIEETKREYGLNEVTKLASNENPLGPSLSAITAMARALPDLHLYPDAAHFDLKKKISDSLKIDFKELVIGNGSNELIDLLIRVFVQPGEELISHQYSFLAYRICAEVSGVIYKEAPVSSQNFKVDVDAILSAVTSKTKMVMLANPNNPTGAFLTRAEIEHLATELNKKQVLFVLDYAYYEYVTTPEIEDPVQLFFNHPNLIILKTFSKIFGIAGARVGYMFAREVICSAIEKARIPFNISSLGLVGAAAAFSDVSHITNSKKHNDKSKKQIFETLRGYDVQVFPTEANFVLVDFKQDAQSLFEEFLKRGIILRPVGNYGLKSFLRISFGLESENKKFELALKEILNG